jgi:hypothetical protein
MTQIDEINATTTRSMTLIRLTSGPEMESPYPIEDVMAAASERHPDGEPVWAALRRRGSCHPYRSAVIYPGAIVLLESLEGG